MSAMTAAVAPVISNFEVGGDNSNSILETDVGMQKMESHMPPIPEEPSRIVSTASLDSNAADRPQLDDVQTLVAEASKVLEELNKAVNKGKHKKDCESKGYESCCSLSSDSSEEEEGEEYETSERLARSSIAVEMPNDHQHDVERTFNL